MPRGKMSPHISTASGLGFGRVSHLKRIWINGFATLAPLILRAVLAGRCPRHYPFAFALGFREAAPYHPEPRGAAKLADAQII